MRIAGYIFPPLGLWLLWRSENRCGSKLLGTAGLLLYSGLYAGVIIFLLVRFAGLQIEWRGGYLPRLTYRPTRPDYDALESDRNARKREFAVPASGGSNQAASGHENKYWTGFRGPRRDGIYDERPISTNWPAAGLKPLWKQPAGGGYGSFAIANGTAYTIEQRRDKEVLVAYDAQTGAEQWVYSWPADFHDFYSEDGPRATPAYSDGKVYALGALGTLTCVDAVTGKKVWQHEIVAENRGTVPSYGIAASPLVMDGKLIVLSAAGNGHSVLCFDKASGKTIWSALDDLTGYASPSLMTLVGEEQIIVCCEQRTVGLSSADGKLLWEVPWHVKNNQLPIAQPVMIGTNRFMLSAGYFTGCAAVQVDREGSNYSARIIWQNSNLKNKFTSSVFWRGYIYGLDEDILTCLDAQTGERKWKDGRYGYGQLILASGCLVVLSGDGELALVRANPERHEELARFQAIHGKTWNHPALADGRLLVRNGAEMACFDLR